MVAVAEKTHAILGPSGWHTWGTCPGSVPLSDGIVDKGSDYAREGSAAHALLEDCLEGGFDAEDLIGRTYTVEGKNFKVDQEMADAVNSAVDIVRSYVRDGAILQVEQQVPLDHMTGETDATGTTDIAIITEQGTHLIILDFKYGKGVQVYASDKEGVPNGQLAMYASGWLQKHGFVFEDVTKVTVGIIQPRIEWLDTAEFPVETIRAFEDTVREAAGRVELNRQVAMEGNELDLVPTEKGCRFCKAKHRCPALKAVASTALQSAAPSDRSDFEDLTLPKQAAAVATLDPEISGEKLAEIMRAAPLIEDFIKAVRAEVERRLFASEPVPGYKLVEGKKGNRQWSDPEAAIKALTASGRLKMADALERKPISPTKAEKAFKGRERVWAQIVELIVQPPGKPSVALDTDTRPAYTPVSTTDEFENIEVIEAQATVLPSLDDLMG